MGIENYSRRVHQEQPNLNPYSPILENLGRTVSGKELILSVVDNVIAPFVKMYMSKQTVAGKTLGKEDHSGSTSKHFYNHLLGKGSLLKQRYEYWKRRLEQEGKNSTNEKIIEKFMADGKIATAEMLSRQLDAIKLKMEREKIGLATPLILALNGLVIAYTTGVYSEAYGNGQTIGYTTIGDPHWAEYEAKYGYTGDCEDFINQYVKEHSGEFFDIEVGNGKIHTNRITCGGDATLILIRDGVINGWYDIKLISEQRDDW